MMVSWARRCAGGAHRVEATPSTAPPSDGRWLSYVDRVTATTVIGWCCDRANPDDSLRVEAVAASGKRSVVLAGIDRDDVRQAGHGTGNHGFEIDLAPFDAADGALLVRFLDSGAPIGRGRIALDPQQAILNDELPPAFLGAMRQLATALRETHARMREADGRADGRTGGARRAAP